VRELFRLSAVMCLVGVFGLVSVGCGDKSTSSAGDTSVVPDEGKPDTTSDPCANCPDGWNCVDGNCEDPECHVDCFGEYWCESGEVKHTPTGPAPCTDQGLDICNEVFVWGVCEHGCAEETGSPDDPFSFCAPAP
jgi:hypothetical protein